MLAEQKPTLDALAITDAAKLRSIAVDIELAHGTIEDAPYGAALYLRFLYDDKNAGSWRSSARKYIAHD